MRFRRVLSALWSKREASHEGIYLVAGVGRVRLASLGGRLVSKKVLIVSVLSFFGAQHGVLVSPWKTRFFMIFGIFGGQKGSPATPE